MSNNKLSEVMVKAHKLAKKMEGDYQARLSLALRQAWKEEKKGDDAVRDVGVIKDWFLRKKGAISLSRGEKFEIAQETKKAVLIKQDLGYKCWVPKSAIDFYSKEEITDFGEGLHKEMKSRFSREEIRELAQWAIEECKKDDYHLDFRLGINLEEYLSWLSFKIIKEEIGYDN